jgi:hypothetical protein
MEAPLAIMCHCFIQSKTSDITCFYLKVVDSRYIDFVNFKDYRSIKCRTLVYRYLLRRIEVSGSILHVHFSNIENLLSNFFHIAHFKISEF